jgi:uncharacterized protein
MAHAEGPGPRVEVVYCPLPGYCDRVRLRLPEGCTALDALRASGLCARHSLDESAVCVGIWGRVQPTDTRLRDLDRVELYRPLQVDPKEARRLRYKRAKNARRADVA